MGWVKKKKKKQNKKTQEWQFSSEKKKKVSSHQTFDENKVGSRSIYMQAPLKSFLSSCFLNRCDSIIGGKYMIKHIMFEEICFPSLRDLEDNYLGACEWQRGSFYYCAVTPMADFASFPLFLSSSHLYFQTWTKWTGQTDYRRAWLHTRVFAFYSSATSPLESFLSWLAENLHSELTGLRISCAPNMSRPKRRGAFVTSRSHTGGSQTAGSLCKICQPVRDRNRISHPRQRDGDKWWKER